jgi:hypothetical protein
MRIKIEHGLCPHPEPKRLSAHPESDAQMSILARKVSIWRQASAISAFAVSPTQSMALPRDELMI